MVATWPGPKIAQCGTNSTPSASHSDAIFNELGNAAGFRDIGLRDIDGACRDHGDKVVHAAGIFAGRDPVSSGRH